MILGMLLAVSCLPSKTSTPPITKTNYIITNYECKSK